MCGGMVLRCGSIGRGVSVTTAQAIVARVVTETPRPMLPQRHTIPPHIEAAVLTALEKLPADRFGSAAEFAEALASPKYGSATTVATPAAVPPKRRRSNAVTLAAFGIAGLATMVALWGWLRPAPTPQVNRFSLLLRSAEALRPSPTASNIAISPDGTKLAYIGPAEGGTRLWLREHDKLRPTPIPGTDNAVSPFFSPDGRQLGFIRNGRTVRILSLEGGPPLTLSDSINSSGGDWGSDGYVYIEVDSGLARIRATGGPLEPIYKFSTQRREIGTEWPNVLPGGRGLIFRVRRAGQAPSEFDIMGMTLPKGEARPLIRGIYARYAASGHLLVVTADGKLLAVPFRPGQGRPQRVTRGAAGGVAVGSVRAESGCVRHRHPRVCVRWVVGIHPGHVGESRRRRRPGRPQLGSAGQHHLGGCLSERKDSGRKPDTGCGSGCLGQAASCRSVLARHLW